MNILARIKKLERQTGANDKFCRCGMPYFATFVISGESIINNVCPDCGRNVKARTRAEFVIDAHKYSFEFIEPKIDEIETI